MELFRNVRLKVGSSILSKKLSKSRRKTFYSSFSHIKSIGIVCDLSRTQDFASLSKFHLKMHERNIDVRIIGYYPGKELPSQYTAIRYLSCIRKDELSFFYLPSSPEADTFIRHPFDVLIDINFKEEFALYIISSLSSARFKVGIYDSDKGISIFDLMMELKKPVQVENYLNEVINYLEMIKSGTES